MRHTGNVALGPDPEPECPFFACSNHCNFLRKVQLLIAPASTVMSANSGSGGVRNLRAMFENKASDQSTSPPSRGRSPNPSELSNNSRPVSKVRASFVAVERAGENGGAPILGLRRMNSEVSSQGEVKGNHTTDNGNVDNAAVETQTPVQAGLVSEPENAAPAAESAIEGGLGNILKGSAFVDSTPAKATWEAGKLGDALSSGLLRDQLPKSPNKSKDEAKAAELVKRMGAAKERKSGPPPTTVLQTTESAQPVKAPPTRHANTRPAPKSPVTSRPSPQTQISPMAHIRGGPAKIRGVMNSAKEAQRARDASQQDAAKVGRTRSSTQKDTKVKPKPATESIKNERTPTSPKTARSPTATRTKSPTRPDKLPNAATAPTAASVARSDAHSSPTEPNSRKAVAKKPSSTSVQPPRASTISTTSTLAKKASRASLTNGHDRPKSRVSTSKLDESFLARMMRPTASSAQKTHEKVQINSPPRKAASSHKPKDAAKHKSPPKMRLHPSGDHANGNNPIGDANGRDRLPEATAVSPLIMVKENPVHDDTQKENTASASTETVEKPDGEATAV